MNIPDEAVEAVVRRYGDTFPGMWAQYRVQIRADLEAAYPLIVAEVAERLQTMCHWHLLYAPSESHRAFHFGYECPYWAMAEVLRGNPDPRPPIGRAR